MLITETSRIPEFIPLLRIFLSVALQSQGNEFPLALLGLRNPVSVSQQYAERWLAGLTESRAGSAFGPPGSEFALNRKK